MSEPISNQSPNDHGSAGGEPSGGVDPAIEQFHERNRQRKRKLIDRLTQGAAIGTGKQIADELDLGRHLVDFIGWLQDNL